MTEQYFEAEVQLDRVLEALDCEGLPLPERVEAALNHAIMLNRLGITVPREIRDEVEAMHLTVATWRLPNTVNAIGRAVGWMDDSELQQLANQFRRWHGTVRALNSHGA